MQRAKITQDNHGLAQYCWTIYNIIFHELIEIYSNEDSGIRVEKTEKLINVYLIDDQH